MSDTLRKVDALYRHIEEVQRNCRLLGERLISQGEDELAVKLIQNAMIHDQSKFRGIEFDYLSSSAEEQEVEGYREKLAQAVYQHNRTNFHHPEYWNGVKNMPDLFIAEMVCDWKARSSEFGTALRDWIDNGAAQRFHYTKRDKVYKSIMRFTKLLLDEPFKKI